MIPIAILVYIVGVVVVAILMVATRGDVCERCGGPCKHETSWVALIVVMLWPSVLVLLVVTFAIEIAWKVWNR